MGHKIKTSIALLCFPIIANANSVSYELFNSSDDDIHVQRHFASYKPFDWGIAISTTNYNSTIKNYQSNGILLDVDTTYKNTSMQGNIGIGNIKNKNYLLGDINVIHHISDNIALNAGVYGDLLDGVAALEQKISFKGINTSVEWETDKGGMLIGFKQAKFSDGNTQHGPFMKIWYSLYPGINVYGISKQHSNAIQSPDYYSPKSYKRNGVGISFRQAFELGRVSGFVEKSNIKTSNSNEAALAWKLQFERKLQNNLSFILSIGRDFGSDSGFNYRYNNISVSYSF